MSARPFIQNRLRPPRSLRRQLKFIVAVISCSALLFATEMRFADSSRANVAPEMNRLAMPAPLFTLPNRLTPDEANAEEFGASMAISGDTLVVGAPRSTVRPGDVLFIEHGSAYVFVREGGEWVEQARLLPDNGQPLDNFGYSVAISGNTVVVGTRFAAYGNRHEVPGRAYVFIREGTTWTLQTELRASDASAEDYFGTSVAIDGDTIAIGADSDSFSGNPARGSVYIFTREAGVWAERLKLLSHDGGPNDHFGNALSLTGNTLVVGAKTDTVGANTNQGSAYVFTGSGANWSEQAKLTATEGLAYDRFGFTTAIDGNTIVIGTDRNNSGAAYVFVFNGTSWAQQATLTTVTTGTYAPNSVAIDGDTALVGTYETLLNAPSGSQGPVFVFVREGQTWTRQTQLSPGAGSTSRRFGAAVLISGDTAIVGASHDNTTQPGGAAYIFTRFSGTGWHQQLRVRAQDGAQREDFASSVAISGDTVVIGSRADDVEGVNEQGSAYVFARKGNAWTFQGKLLAPDGRQYDEFGQSVAIDGDTIVVGSDSATGTNYEQGAAYVFQRLGSSWRFQAKLIAKDGRRYDYFGRSVGIHGNTIVVGASHDHRLRQSQGSAYVFTRSGVSWRQTAKLLASDGRARDFFGVSVAVHNQTIAVGASPITFNERSHREAVYIFEPRGSIWTQRQRLRALDNAAGFARSIAMDERTLVAGSNEEIVEGQEVGAAYVFRRVGSHWVGLAKLLPISLDAAVRHFGNSVSVSGDRIAVGATSLANANQPYGYFFVFKQLGNTWSQEARLEPAAPLVSTGLATPVAISGKTIVAGAPWEKIGANVNQGAAYIYVYLTETSWMP
ncbi:MAG TPA: hypothetical protein VGW36_01575 [Pyrinomonadaceae bacterium]|nr:hypothetical protein [Pyrinomonadaceae bacterium]